MKKVLFLIGLVFVFLNGMTQRAVLNLNAGKTFEEYDGVAADTIHGTTTITKYIHVNVDYLYYFNIEVDVDSIVDGGSATLALYGSDAIAGTYTQIGSTQTWDIADTEGKTFWFNNRVQTTTNVTAAYTIKQDTATFKYYPADSIKVPAVTTTVTFTENGVMWKYLKVLITGVGATTEISLDAIRVKIVKIPR
jgi:hypothetical protein